MTAPATTTRQQLAASPRRPVRKGRRRHAVTPGILAQSLIPESLESYESYADFDAFLNRLLDDFAPQTAMENFLVERIATLGWRLGRLNRAEAGQMAQNVAVAQGWPSGQAHIAEQPVHVGSQLLERDQGLTVDCEPQLFAQGVVNLCVAVEREDTAWLRGRLADIQDDPSWTDAGSHSEDSVRQQAVSYMLALARKVGDLMVAGVDVWAPARVEAMAADSDVQPRTDSALAHSRDEAMLDRQLYRALTMLERIQRRRVALLTSRSDGS